MFSLKDLRSVKLLIKNGADPRGVDKQGQSVLDLAKSAGVDSVIKYLDKLLA